MVDDAVAIKLYTMTVKKSFVDGIIRYNKSNLWTSPEPANIAASSVEKAAPSLACGKTCHRRCDHSCINFDTVYDPDTSLPNAQGWDFQTLSWNSCVESCSCFWQGTICHQHRYEENTPQPRQFGASLVLLIFFSRFHECGG